MTFSVLISVFLFHSPSSSIASDWEVYGGTRVHDILGTGRSLTEHFDALPR